MLWLKGPALEVVRRVMCDVSEGKEGGQQCQAFPMAGHSGLLEGSCVGGAAFPLVLAVHWDIMWPVKISSSFFHKCHKMNSHPLTTQLESPPRCKTCFV